MLDEIQRVAHLLSYLQPRIDDDPTPGRWVLTGSQNLALLESVSQSLAGRSVLLELLPLVRDEVVRFDSFPTTLDEALLTGGYPRILDQRLDPVDWLAAYVATYVERDVRSVSNVGDLVTYQRMLKLAAGRTAQLLNYSALASACWLLGIRSTDQLRLHPLRGAIFESWVASEILKHRRNAGESAGLSHYRDRHGAEVDLVVDRPAGPVLVEAKAARTVSPSLYSTAIRVADELAGEHRTEIVVVYGGDELQRRDRVTLVPWDRIGDLTWI